MAYVVSNAAAKVVNNAGGTVASAIDIEGGYFPIDKLANIPEHATFPGALCYCQEDSKFYQYNDDSKSWIEVLATAAASVKAGTENDDIIVTPNTTTGDATVAHKTYSTDTYTKTPTSSSKTGDIYFFDSITTNNGHVTGGTMKSLASILEGMTFIIDGGTSAN